MHTVTIHVSSPYPVHIGAGLLSQSGALIASAVSARRCVLVTDSGVAPIYAETVRTALERAGVAVFPYILDAGEQHKTLPVCAGLLSWFAQCELTRTDFAVALGGGVVGDLTGFACAVYQRGIDFIQMPTTLLAACDASVGGKTAVDLPEGKNLAGAFHQPRMVICDTDTFKTLPVPIFAEGMAEVIKHALIADSVLLAALAGSEPIDINELVRRNVEIKADFVCADEREHGARKMLNFGHTLGHAIERCSSYSIPHGEAVAMGMALVCRAAERLGYSPSGTHDAVCSLLDKFQLPTECPYTADELFSAATADKKRQGDTIDIIVLKALGQGEILHLTLDELRHFTEASL